MTFDPASGVVTGSYLLVHDQVGSVVRTADLATRSAVESVAYDPWGVATVAPGGTAVHPFGFAGGLWDRRTGLVRFGAREYDAGLGRWLARDPIGFGGGWNQYAYGAGDPVGMVDPTGFWPDGPPSSLPGHSSNSDLERESARDAFTTVLPWVLPWVLPELLPPKLLPFWRVFRAGRQCDPNAGHWTQTSLPRARPGRDGAHSEHIVEKLNGETTSITHRVTKDGEVIHQHQTHIGKYGTKREFPNEWVEFPKL